MFHANGHKENDGGVRSRCSGAKEWVLRYYGVTVLRCYGVTVLRYWKTCVLDPPYLG